MYRLPVPHPRTPCVIESLEGRQMLAAWGQQGIVTGQAQAAQSYPNLTGAGTSIAVIDTGVDYNHPSLGGGWGKKVIAGYDFLDNDSDPMDGDGHGTGVASLAAGLPYTYRGQQYQGVAPAAKIIALRVKNLTMKWGQIAVNTEKALQWVIANAKKYNIVAVNLSFGQGHFATHDVKNVQIGDELAKLKGMGIVTVAASGNDGLTQPNGVEYPAADPSVVAAGATYANGNIWEQTERGKNLDLLAPGAGITLPYYIPQSRQHIYIAGGLGTSWSPPWVTGTAALLKQLKPTLSASDSISIMKSSGVTKSDRTGSWKLLNINNAIKTASSWRPTPNPNPNPNPNPPPTPPPPTPKPPTPKPPTPPPSNNPPGSGGSSNGIAYDDSGNLHMAWYDEGSHNLKYARRATNGSWSGTTTVDGSSMAGQFVSLAIDENNRPGVAYYDAKNGDLKYAHFNGSSWDVQRVDSTNTTGYYPSLEFGAFAVPFISYYYKTRGDLRLAGLGTHGWEIETIESAGDVGRYSSLAFSPATGRWAVAYEDTSHGWFKYASQSRLGWTPTVVDKTRVGGGYISLAFSAKTKLPAMSYYDAYNADLKYARFDGATWSRQTVAAKGTVGLYSDLQIDAGNGAADILYYSRNADAVFRAHSSGAGWSLQKVASGGGRWINRALDDSGDETLIFVRSSGGLTVAAV